MEMWNFAPPAGLRHDPARQSGNQSALFPRGNFIMTSFEREVLGRGSDIMSHRFVWGIIGRFCDETAPNSALEPDVAAWTRLRDVCEKLRSELRLCSDDGTRAMEAGSPTKGDMIDLYRMARAEALAYDDKSTVCGLLKEAAEAFFECNRIVERDQLVRDNIF